MEITETTFARDRRAWRRWLERYHAQKKEVWLLLLKRHVDEPCVGYDAAVEEALCFGWIDGILKRVDDRSHVVRFSPRKPRSRWSASNVKRVERMVARGKMTEAGLAMVEAGKRSGAWQAARQEQKLEDLPDDLARALARNKRAQANFQAFAPGYRRDYIRYVLQARRPETRTRRIRKVVQRSAQNKKPGIDI
jgi:uncharacterized protein YdeI (YjbR/CyaY-like superfamily)